MSLKDNKGLMEKYFDWQGEDIGSIKIKISREQVMELVVVELINKYKACAEKYKESFANVLRFYLTEEEFREIEIIQQNKGENKMDSREKTQEALAEYICELRNTYMEYILEKSVLNEDGTITISGGMMNKWKRRINTKYENLPETEKYSDRYIASRILDKITKIKYYQIRDIL